MSKRFALIIASYQFENPTLHELIAPGQDAEALARVLSDPKIGSFDEHTLLINKPSYLVSQEIETFFNERKRDDLLLLYYSGHGIKDEDGKLYFATPNTQNNILRSTAIPAALINDVMRRSRSRRQVLILDCCYSGAFARGMVAKADMRIGTKDFFEGQGRVVLTASDAMQYAFEGDAVRGEGVCSIFTHTLVDGLQTGKADINEDGKVSLDELYEYVFNRILDEKPEQKPGMWAFDIQGELIIAQNPNPVIKTFELPAELQESITDPRPWVREGAVHELGRLLKGDHLLLAQAASNALKLLLDDDSHKVKDLASQILSAHTATAPGLEIDRLDEDKLEDEIGDAVHLQPDPALQRQLATDETGIRVGESATMELPSQHMETKPMEGERWITLPPLQLRNLMMWIGGGIAGIIVIISLIWVIANWGGASPIGAGYPPTITDTPTITTTETIESRIETPEAISIQTPIKTKTNTPEVTEILTPAKTIRPTSTTIVSTPTETITYTTPTESSTDISGELIAFVSNRDDNYEIYVMDADGSNQTRLTNNSSYDFAPAWTPDGQQIVFISNRNGTTELFKMNPDGSNQIRVGDINPVYEENIEYWGYAGRFPYSIDISPDGGQIVSNDYILDNEAWVIFPRLALTDMASGNTDNIPFFDLRCGHIDSVSWSPDGSKIAMTACSIYIVNSSSGKYNQLLDFDEMDGGMDDVAWSSDDRKLAFTAYFHYKPGWCISIVNPYGGYPEQLTECSEGNYAQDPSWSNDAEQIAFSLKENENWEIYKMNWEIYKMNADGSEKTNLSNNSAGDDISPAWQP